jgi:hypothetical protein
VIIPVKIVAKGRHLLEAPTHALLECLQLI